MSQQRPSTQDPFVDARTALDRLQLALAGPKVDLLGMAKAYAAFAEALYIAVQQTGQTSMRFAAVVKALDLRTPKSALQHFLNESS